MINDFEHLICVSLEKSLFKFFVHFLIRFLLLLSCRISLYVFFCVILLDSTSRNHAVCSNMGGHRDDPVSESLLRERTRKAASVYPAPLACGLQRSGLLSGAHDASRRRELPFGLFIT